MRQFLSSVCFCRFVNFGTLGTKYGNGIALFRKKKWLVVSSFLVTLFELGMNYSNSPKIYN